MNIMAQEYKIPTSIIHTQCLYEYFSKNLLCLILQETFAKAKMKMVLIFIKFITPHLKERNF